MLSTILELLGLIALAAATYLYGGINPATLVVGVELLFLGWSLSSPTPVARGARRPRRRLPGPVTNETLGEKKR